MTQPRIVVQLVVTTADKVGALADVTQAIFEERVNIDALCCYSKEGKAVFYIITRDNTKAKAAIIKKGWQAKDDEVVVIDLENKPGSLNNVLAKLKAQGVNILYCYGSTGEHDTYPCHFVFKAVDNKAALAALN